MASVINNDLIELVSDSELEVSVEDLRSNVINKKTRVSMADVEKLASLLSQSRYLTSTTYLTPKNYKKKP